MPFAIPPYVRVASVDGDLVFLDARRNAYLCIARGAAAVLSGPDREAGRSLLGSLAAEQLVCPEPASPAWTQLSRARPRCDFHDLAGQGPPITLAAIGKLITAAICGWLQLAVPRPERWFDRSRRTGEAVPTTHVATLAMQFDRLRPFVPRSGRCLASSIILLGFLRRHGVEADWVFGVKTFPFDAHCWVEYDGVVLNDLVEHASWFTPIAEC